MDDIENNFKTNCIYIERYYIIVLQFRLPQGKIYSILNKNQNTYTFLIYTLLFVNIKRFLIHRCFDAKISIKYSN